MPNQILDAEGENPSSRLKRDRNIPKDWDWYIHD